MANPTKAHQDKPWARPKARPQTEDPLRPGSHLQNHLTKVQCTSERYLNTKLMMKRHMAPSYYTIGYKWKDSLPFTERPVILHYIAIEKHLLPLFFKTSFLALSYT
ncbi:hypothetical protein GOBAR_AA31691 [Gossypium barbadense]|uniref:Uncharacterized protein n=1 Tax=Gossypium barbadense TaxID=3634 RepID=A0A2P5WD27_GOSBA|nr:hypothetical protein GOBAR_AA31691 [Gossypium barbadense]